MSEHLQIVVDAAAEPTSVAVAGELDPSTAPLLRAEIDQLVAGGTTALVIDLRGLTFMDSTGLREILRARNELDAITLRSPSDTVRRLLDITGLTDHIEITD